MFDLKNKVALVTGARRGMGKAHALALAAQSAKVVVTDVDEKECAVEWASLGINVNAIAPGAIDTPMVQAAQMPKEAMDAMLRDVPLKRIGRSEEVSAAVIFLASEEASYITGATLYVDGGWLAA